MVNKIIIAIIIGIAGVLLVVLNANLNAVTAKGTDRVSVLQDQENDKKEETEKESGKEGEESEEDEEEELDYELGKVDPNTKKATRYVCKGCGEVMLQPFKCEICEKDAEKEELDVEEKKGKWYIKGTNIMVVEKEPDEEETSAEGEVKSEEGSKEK